MEPKPKSTLRKLGAVFGWTLFVLLIVAVAFPVFAKARHGKNKTAGNLRRLTASSIMYASDFDGNLPFPGGPQGGPLAGPGSPAWVIAGLQGAGDPTKTGIDYVAMARPKEGSIFPYVQQASVFRFHQDSEEFPRAENPEHIVNVITFQVHFTMSEALAPVLNEDGSIKPVNFNSFEDPSSVALFIVEHPSTMSGGAFVLDSKRHGYPMSQFYAKGSSVTLSRLSGNAKPVSVEVAKTPGFVAQAFPSRNEE